MVLACEARQCCACRYIFRRVEPLAEAAPAAKRPVENGAAHAPRDASAKRPASGASAPRAAPAAAAPLPAAEIGALQDFRKRNEVGCWLPLHLQPLDQCVMRVDLAGCPIKKKSATLLQELRQRLAAAEDEIRAATEAAEKLTGELKAARTQAETAKAEVCACACLALGCEQTAGCCACMACILCSIIELVVCGGAGRCRGCTGAESAEG